MWRVRLDEIVIASHEFALPKNGTVYLSLDVDFFTSIRKHTKYSIKLKSVLKISTDYKDIDLEFIVANKI